MMGHPAVVRLYLVLFASTFYAIAAWTPLRPSSLVSQAVVSNSSPYVNTRNEFLRQVFLGPITITRTTVAILLASSSAATAAQPAIANAAPPFAIMAEELGYFPVIDERSGATVLVPAKIKRHSTSQAIALAKYLQSTNTIMYGSYWCPHCSRQKELFGMEAFKFINYIECDPKGYRSKYATCLENGVDGYPSWKFGNGKSQGGEMELIDIAKFSGYIGDNKNGRRNDFDASLEFGVPALGGAACR